MNKKLTYILFKSIGKALCILWLLVSTMNVHAQDSVYTLKISGVNELQEFFRFTPDRIPMVSSHRGGATRSFPENSIAAFENTMRAVPTFFEVDPRLTKDSVIVVLHDATLDRTTTGTGKLADHTWEEVKKLKLKDPEGNISSYGVSTLDEVMTWAKGKTVLMLDKKDVPMNMLLDKINKHKAESFALVSAYSVEEAIYYHRKNKQILFEAFIRDEEELKRYDSSGIPWKNIIAYIVRPKNVSLFQKLHQRGVMCIVYTAKTIERLPEINQRIAGYKNIIRNGGDIILADKVLEASAAIKEFIPVESSKKKFFIKSVL